MQLERITYYSIPAKWKLAICLFSLFQHFALSTRCSTECVTVEQNFKASKAEKLASWSLTKNYRGTINVYTYEARRLEKPVCLPLQGYMISLGYLYLLSKWVRTWNFRKSAHFRQHRACSWKLFAGTVRLELNDPLNSHPLTVLNPGDAVFSLSWLPEAKDRSTDWPSRQRLDWCRLNQAGPAPYTAVLCMLARVKVAFSLENA